MDNFDFSPENVMRHTLEQLAQSEELNREMIESLGEDGIEALCKKKTREERVRILRGIYKDFTIDLAETPKRPQFLVEQVHEDGNIGALPVGNLVAVTGKPKGGKGMFIKAITASVMGSTEFGFVSTATEPPTVVYCDLEQDITDVDPVARDIHRLLNWPQENDTRVTVIHLSEMDIAERKTALRVHVAFARPSLVIVDGIADLAADVNSEVEAASLLENLRYLASRYRCCMLTILHQNKGNDHLKGHLGSYLSQKASDTYEISDVGEGFFSVEVVNSRHRRIENFRLRYDQEDRLPHLAEMPAAPVKETAKEITEEAVRELFISKIFGGDRTKTMRRGEMQEASGLPPTTFDRYAEAALNLGVIEKTGKGKMTPYKLNILAA